jgi:hypothetical protein
MNVNPQINKRDKYAHTSTIVLITLFMLGKVLPSIPVMGYNLPLYIPYILIHIGILIIHDNKNKKKKIKLPIPLIILSLFFVYAILSLSWESTIQGIVRAGFLLPSIIITYLIFWSSSGRWEVRNYIRVVLIVGLIAIIIGFVEIVTGFHLPVSRQFSTPPPNLATGWYHNPNNFAYTISFIAFFYFSMAMFSEQKSKNMIGLFGFFSIYYIILHSDARSSLIAVTGGSILMGCIYIHKQRVKISGSKLNLVKNTPLALVYSILLIMFAFVLLKNPFSQFSSIWYRWQLHEASIYMLFQTFGLGTGISGFSEYVSELYILPKHSMAPHGWLPAILGECGLIGLVSFLTAYGYTLNRLLTDFYNNNDLVALTLFISLGSFLISGVGPSTPIVLEIHWAIWGISIVYGFTE